MIEIDRLCNKVKILIDEGDREFHLDDGAIIKLTNSSTSPKYDVQPLAMMENE